MPDKMSIMKFDPKARKHVEYKGSQAEVIFAGFLNKNRPAACRAVFFLKSNCSAPALQGRQLMSRQTV